LKSYLWQLINKKLKMKRIFLFALTSVLVLSVGFVFAQEKLKEGKVTYEISYPEAEEMNDQMLAMMPTESVVYFKNGKMRSETKMGFGNTVMLYDPEKKGIVRMHGYDGKEDGY
jgi:hypothetical protein